MPRSNTKPQSKPKSKPKGLSASAMAAQVSTAVGRTVTPKTIRQWARDHITRFGDETYTVHAYSTVEARRIRDAFVKSNARRQASVAADQDDSTVETDEA